MSWYQDGKAESPRYGPARRRSSAAALVSSTSATIRWFHRGDVISDTPGDPMSPGRTCADTMVEGNQPTVAIRNVEAQMEFGQFLYSLIVIFFMIIYFMILFNIIFDIFRSHDMGGVAKALWLIFILFIPILSMLIYVIVRGPGMAKAQPGDGEGSSGAAA